MRLTGALVAAALPALTALAPRATAATIVSVPTTSLLPNTAGQVVTISISGGDPVQGAQLTPEFSGTSPLPGITDGTIINGTIFAGNNVGESNNLFDGSSIAFLDTATESGTVSGDGTLATLVVDTTGIFSGAFTLNFTGTSYGDSAITRSQSATGDVTFVPGVIAVPEPTSLAAVGGVAALLLRRRRMGV